MSRISPGTIIVAIFAVLFGLIGAYAIRRQLEPKQVVAEPARQAPAAADPFINIPLSALELTSGRELRLGDIAVMRVRQSQLKNLPLPKEYMLNPQQIVGRVLREPMKKGEAFQPDRFYPEGMGPSISERLKPGMRAVTVGVSGTGILGGLVNVGTMVDVLFRTREDTNKDIPELTMTLLEGVEILAIEENIVPGAKNPDTAASVTLAVSTRQANVLKIMEGRGEFSLALRSDGDENLVSYNGPQTISSILGLPPRQKPQTVEVYRGGSRSVLVFDRGRVADDFTNVKPVTDAAPKGNPQANGSVVPTNTTEVIDLVGSGTKK